MTTTNRKVPTWHFAANPKVIQKSKGQNVHLIQPTKKGKFAYGTKTVVYESRGRSQGVGNLQIPRLQDHAKLNAELKEQGFLTIAGRVTESIS